MLSVKGLKAGTVDKVILNGVDLEIGDGQVHVLMGPNGSGKSTLAQVLMGHPSYEVKEGNVVFNDENLLENDTTERALQGLFLSFQYPSEVEGVTISSYLRLIYNKSHNENVSPAAFRKILREKMDLLGMKEDMMNRYLNDGFSGGEKKRMEMLQMLVLEPKLAILDEVDSGLDIDALRVVAKAVNSLKEKTGLSVFLITHYTRILKHIEPDYVHVMQDGVVTKSGSRELAHELEEKGYAPFGD